MKALMKRTLLVLLFAAAILSIFVSCNKEPEVVKYRVKVMNGEDVYKEKEVVEGDVYVLPSVPADTRPFMGWKVGESTELLQPGEELKITADAVVFAVWAQSCTVKFDLGDDALDKIADATVDYGATVSAPTSVPNRPGYAFAG